MPARVQNVRKPLPRIPEIPTEIINVILDEAYFLAPKDLRALLSYGLVSRQWLQYARYLYFSHRQYEFKGGYQYSEWREENDELIRLLRARTGTLRGTITNMGMKGSDETCGRHITSCGNAEDYMYLNRLFTYQLSAFVNLQRLTLKTMHWVMLKPDSVAVLMELKSLTSLTMEKVTFKDMEHLFDTLLQSFSRLEELKLAEINFSQKAIARPPTDEPPQKLSFLPRLRRVELDMHFRMQPLLDTRCLPVQCEYLGFREITSVGHLLKIKALVQYAGADLRHLFLDIQVPVPYLLVDFTRNENLRRLDVSYCVPYDHEGPWSLGWLAEAVNTIVSPKFSKLNLDLWFYHLKVPAIERIDLPVLEEALIRKMVAAGSWRSAVYLTFMQTRRVIVGDFDAFIIGVRKQMRTLDRQRRLSVMIDY